jgi:hypothetical protein
MATSIDDHDIPNTYLRQFFRYLGSRESLLADTSETPDSLSQLGGRNSFRDHCRFFHNAIAELNSPGIGLVLGRLNQISNMHGALGTAIFNSQTIGDCLQLLQRYLPLRMPFIRVDRVQEGDSEGLTFTFLHDDPAIHPALCEALLLGVNSVIALISRQSMQSSILELDYPPPSYANDYGSAFQVSSIRFSQPALRLLLPKQAMTYATNTDPDHLLAESAIARCEQLLQGSTCSSNVSTRVTQLFNDNPGRIWPLKEVAGHLNMSVATTNCCKISG